MSDDTVDRTADEIKALRERIVALERGSTTTTRIADRASWNARQKSLVGWVGIVVGLVGIFLASGQCFR